MFSSACEYLHMSAGAPGDQRHQISLDFRDLVNGELLDIGAGSQNQVLNLCSWLRSLKMSPEYAISCLL